MDEDAGIQALRDAVEAARASARQPDLLRAYRDLGAGYLDRHEYDQAESALRTSVQQARVCGDALDLGSSLHLLGRVLARTRRTDRALLALTEAVACLRGRDETAHAQAASEIASIGTVPGGAR